MLIEIHEYIGTRSSSDTLTVVIDIDAWNGGEFKRKRGCFALASSNARLNDANRSILGQRGSNCSIVIYGALCWPFAPLCVDVVL